MTFRVDEGLSPELVERAWRRGFGESSPVVWLGKAGWTDGRRTAFRVDGDGTFVTRNAVDVRGPAARPGTKGHDANVAIHAGLVCRNGPDGMDLDRRRELFAVARDDVDRDRDLVNQVLAVTLEHDAIHVLRSALPAG